MRIVCDACDARYAVDDARLSGHKTYKVRCRRCGQMIVVKSASGTRPRWHLVVQGSEVGPLTTSEVIAGVDTGDLHGATLVWREGLADWRRLSEVGELRDHLSCAPDAQPRHVGLFDVDVSPPPDGGEAGVPLTGSRNESSVLFSIANLRALAESSPRQVESGLIDIHALAPAPAPTYSEDHESTLVSSYATAAAPLLVPEEPRRARWLVPALAGVGAALLTTTVVFVVVLTLGEQSEAAAPAAPRAKEVKPAPRQPPPAQPQEVTPKPASKAEENTKQPTAKKRRRRRNKRRARSEPRVVAKAPQKTEEKKDALTRLIDDATKVKGKSYETPVEKVKAKTESLPTTLDRGQIRAGVHALRARVKACFNRYRVPGTAYMKLTISPQGRMARVLVRGRFAGTPTGACLRQVFMTARFPRFSGPPLSVNYPVFLR